jgi:hypothetical protein
MDTSKYALHYTSPVHGNFYTAIDPNNYHLSRYVAAGVQNIYSSSGSTRDVLDALTQKMLDIINTGSTGRIISDMSVLVNNLRYRINYPIDADAAIRMGAIYVIHEDENPDDVSPAWTDKKLKMTQDDRRLYEVFFSLGLISTESWKERLIDLERMTSYLNERRTALASLSIQ